VKGARLDRILAEMGLAGDDEIRLALARQRTHGGRLGENLLALGLLLPGQLMQALARQYGTPWRSVAAADVPRELRGRLPPPGRHGSLAVPLSWDPEAGTVEVAMNDPEDAATLEWLRTDLGARRIVVQLAPDEDLKAARDALSSGATGEEDSGVIELPDLFGDPEEEAGEEEAVGGEADFGAPNLRVLLVTSRAQHRSFLPSIFGREGCELVTGGTREQVAGALAGEPFDALLVDEERWEDVQDWIRSGAIPRRPPRVARFHSVSRTLVENLVPYPEMARSLRAAAEALADQRARGMEPPPPYGLLGRDVEALARRDGLPQLAVDGLYILVHLLLPPHSRTELAAPEPFHALPGSRELAVRLRFPWPLAAVLDRCLALFLGARAPEPPGSADPEMVGAARILALVWYHHILSREPEGHDGEEGVRMRTALREAAGRLATVELVESYLRVIQERRAAGDVGEVAQILLVGGERMRELGARLGRVGVQPLVTRDLVDAQVLAERRPPAAIVVDHAAVPGPVDHFARVAKLDAALFLYVVTDAPDAAVALGLLDVGVDDVFPAPHDFDLIAARIARALSGRARVRSALQGRGGDFSASLGAFSFLDLAQALAHGRKSVRVELTRPGTGEEALFFLERGRPVHARCGALEGAEAVYRIIAWEEDGEFVVHPESDFPPTSIEGSIESLLMEGCRRLDEGSGPVVEARSGPGTSAP